SVGDGDLPLKQTATLIEDGEAHLPLFAGLDGAERDAARCEVEARRRGIEADRQLVEELQQTDIGIGMFASFLRRPRQIGPTRLAKVSHELAAFEQLACLFPLGLTALHDLVEGVALPPAGREDEL